MARPKKKTVDYFPHSCESGRTIFILEQSFGNDGYAFWFKLLELLGKTKGHYLDCRNQEDFEFLQAKTRTDEVLTCKILDLLCRLNAIDKELWKNRVIWCQNFVDNIAEVYLNRRVEIPSKPANLQAITHQSTSDNTSDVKLHDVSTSHIPQSKTIVKQSKEKQSKQKGENSENEFPLQQTENILNGNGHKEKLEPIKIEGQDEKK